ncbi:MAG: class I tRNA ligase family protein [Isosphaeraceae bacterium]
MYVNFPIVGGLPEAWGGGSWHAMIWTTTPWTLPANVAIAAHPDLDYVGLRYVDPTSGQNVQTVLAAELVVRDGSPEGPGVHRGWPAQGRVAEHATYRHPFVDRTSPIVLASYVSVDDGTGLVTPRQPWCRGLSDGPRCSCRPSARSILGQSSRAKPRPGSRGRGLRRQSGSCRI